VRPFTPETLGEYLSGRLASGTVEVSNIEEHVEGWSRDTFSLDATYQTAAGETETEELVIRAEAPDQLEQGAAEGADIETEFTTMDAVQDAPVPLPTTHWLEDDESLFGRRFFVVEYLPGSAPVTWDPRERSTLYDAWDDPDRQLPHQFVDAVAGIHSVSAEDVPGIETVPADEVVDRHLDRWEQVYRDSGFAPEPALEEAIRWFRANKPEVPETTLVHGDFRIGNTLVEDNELQGVLDWELAHCGAPLYDLGYASVPYFAGKLLEPIERPELACALLERDWFYEQYERRTGRHVDRDRVQYWQAFCAFVMLTQGLDSVDRFTHGPGSDVRSGWFQYIVPGLIEDALDIVRQDRI
jgi:aminoglycoside phosphotransferase (APT) family kinase protein